MFDGFVKCMLSVTLAPSIVTYWPLLCLLLMVVAMAGCVLIPPILWPPVISYPWDESIQAQYRDRDQTVILAGSYNPPHKGHLAMLEYLASRYEQVVAVVGMNPDKKYLVLPDERASLIRTMLQGSSQNLHNVRVEVVSGYIWRYAKRIRATLFVRGIRTWEKDGADERSLQILNTWGPLLLGPAWPVPTVYMEGRPEYNGISSSLVRQIVNRDTGDDARSPIEVLSRLVPASIVEQVAALYTRKES